MHEESLERTNVEHQHRLENLEQKMAVAVATATAIADTVRSEHDELSERIGAAATHSEEVEQQLHAQIDALGVSMRMAGVRSPAATSNFSRPILSACGLVAYRPL